MSSTERKKRVWEVLERAGMAHRAGHLPNPAVRRAAAARGGRQSLGSESLILLTDEPTGNLDSKNGEAAIELLDDRHKQGATIFMVTHDPRYAQHADRIVHLFDGRLEEKEAAMEEVYS
ncbi:MAG: hypothetical protein JXR49_11725 [Acidobacteria bacterium]|nr:hypothetical protein [Acidobacteriota bacterium]